MILALVLAALVVPVVPISAGGPEDEESSPALPVEVREEIEKQLADPVYPTKRPPLTGAAQPSRGSKDLHSDIWDPWKSGSDARGKSMTQAFWIYGEVKWVYAYVWLWKWENNQWVKKDDGSDWGYCGGIFPRCTVYAYATYSNAETAWYINTSRHIIDQLGVGRIYFNELESDMVYLEF